MSWAIRCEDLSKLYRFGSDTAAVDHLYQHLNGWMRARLGLPVSAQHNEPGRTEMHVVSDAQLDGAPEGHFWALRDVSFEIGEGERVGIIGRNGSGKSTLLKILSRITSPTVGSFKFRGRLVSLLEVGTGFHAELSGRENIYLNASINGMSKAEVDRRYDEIVEFSELGEQIETPIKRYSSGMYMRLAFSVAAYLESEILIVDEVLAVGDAGFQKKCTEKMLEISNRGRTLLFVSHSMDAVNKLCSHAIELSHGRLVSRFKAERPIEHPTDSEAIYVDGEHSGTPSLASARDVTSEYLLRDKFFGAERKWEPLKAPSFRDGAVTLLAVRILDRKGKLRRSFDVKESFFIEYEFVVNEEKWAMNAHVYLKTLEGQNILLSMDNLDLPNPEAARRAGRHIERCEIATPLLNEGVYTIEVVICTHPTTEYNIVVPEAASFVITDDMSPEGVRGNWSREWNTYPIRPRMHWTIRHEPPADERPVLDGETPGVQIPHHRESHS